jgi:DNA-directed RNA polymerase subunit RPC12/RpoP
MISKKDKCKICKAPTEASFNLNFDLVPICEYCASKIFLQQAQWYVKEGEVNKARQRVKDKGKAKDEKS